MNKMNDNSTAKENDSVFSRMNETKCDEKFYDRARDEFCAQTMMIHMYKTPDEIELEEYLKSSEGGREAEMNMSDFVFDVLKEAPTKLKAYVQLNAVGDVANFFVKTLLAQQYPKDKLIDNVVMTHLDMLQFEILKQRMQIRQLSGEGIELPAVSPEYALKRLEDVQRDHPEFFPEGRQGFKDFIKEQEARQEAFREKERQAQAEVE